MIDVYTPDARTATRYVLVGGNSALLADCSAPEKRPVVDHSPRKTDGVFEFEGDTGTFDVEKGVFLHHGDTEHLSRQPLLTMNLEFYRDVFKCFSNYKKYVPHRAS
jgi:hypothetical protein